MKVLFLHGWTSSPGGRKPTYLSEHGCEVHNPALPDDDFPASVEIANRELQNSSASVIVGSSRGGAVAMNMRSGATPLVLLCPAWKKWGEATTVKNNTLILHSRHDHVIPYADSEELIANSQLSPKILVEIGNDHRLADRKPLRAMLKACQKLARQQPLVDVSVSYLEMLQPPQRAAPEDRDELQVLRVLSPSVSYYRFLYDSVGGDYHWLSRRIMSDQELGELLADPGTDVFVLHFNGAPAGFAELDRRKAADIELVQFGLFPHYIGQGLGKWFLHWIVNQVWNRQPNRFWLHTCSLDHPAAIPNYQQAGFQLYRTEQIRRQL